MADSFFGKLVGGVCFAAYLWPGPSASARELSFAKADLYYEILFDLSLAWSTSTIQQHFEGGEGRNSFPTQAFDDRAATVLHGDTHTSYMTDTEKKADQWSDYINCSLRLVSLVGPLFNPSGHRLGAFMSFTHAHHIWSFFSRTLKHTVDRQRPKFHYTGDARTSDTTSFPSGHTGQAFVVAFAADFFLEPPTWVKVGLYSAASTTAYLRVKADRHFLSDVIAGAGFAYLGAWAAYKLFEEPEDDAKQAGTVRLQASSEGVGVTYYF